MAERELLKISELARRAGVGRGTIQHYLREGLLPRPVKTHRNMAYYDPSCVDRIKQIKELQNKRHLPLNVIKKLLGGASGKSANAKALIEVQQTALDAMTPPSVGGSLTPVAAAKAFKLRPKLIEEMRRMGLVTTRLEDGKEVFAGGDLEVLAAVSNLESLGFRQTAGFKSTDLKIYRKSMADLLEKEIETFVRVLTKGNFSAEMAKSAVDAATMLVVAVRRKLIMDLLSSPDAALFSTPREKTKKKSKRKR